MKVYLVRHCKAAKRTRFPGADLERPLNEAGRWQARSLARLFEREGVARILSSPHRRCRETVAPLAEVRGLKVEVDQRLAEGESIAKAWELLRGLEGAPVVCASHADLISGLVTELEERGAEIEGPFGCEKGSVWRVSGASGAPERAVYVPPPDRAPRVARAGLPGMADLGPGSARIAVLDLGSTSFHLLVADAAPGGMLAPVLRERLMLRLGAVTASGERIPEEVCARAEEAARSFRKLVRGAGAERVLPLATAALREAANGSELAERIGAALGTPVRVVTGREEARLILGAFRRRLALGEEAVLGLDLGGGSLELAAGRGREALWEGTLPLGTTRLHGALVRSDPMTAGERESVRERVRGALAPVREAVAALAPERVAVAGGTARALGRLFVARAGLPPAGALNGLSVRAAELEALAEELARTPLADRLALPGMQRRRADLLPTGALVLAETLAALGCEGVTLCDWGLREGAIFAALEGVPPLAAGGG